MNPILSPQLSRFKYYYQRCGSGEGALRVKGTEAAGSKETGEKEVLAVWGKIKL